MRIPAADTNATIAVLAVIVWETIFRASAVILQQLVRSKNSGFLLIPENNASNFNDKPQSSPNDTNKLMSKRMEKIASEGPSYVVAFIHALILSIRGCMHFYQLFYTPTKFQMMRIHANDILTHSEVNASDYRYISNAHASVYRSNYFFFGFLFYDLLHIIIVFPRLGGIDIICHHLAFMVASVINDHYKIMMFPFAWLIMGELSTIFLNIRWFLIQTGRGSTKVMDACNFMFAYLFFSTRILLYGWGLIHLLSNSNYLFYAENEDVNKDDYAPKWCVIFVCSMLVGGYSLNLVWMKSIYAIATGSQQSSSKKLKESPQTAKKSKKQE